MGMSASQIRLLSLTERLSDLEFEGQQISNARLKLAESSEYLTTEYTKSLNEKKLVYLTGFNGGSPVYTDLTARLLMNYNPNSTETQKIIKNAQGNVLLNDAANSAYYSSNGDLNTFLTTLNITDATEITYYTNIFNEVAKCGAFTTDATNLTDADWLYNGFKDGSLQLAQFTIKPGEQTGSFDSISWNSSTGSIQEVADTDELAKDKAEYEAMLSSLQSQDKKLELNLKELETAHNAAQTEYEAVKKTIDKNIESSFKIFS